MLIDVMEVLVLIELELSELAEFLFGPLDLFLELFEVEELLLESDRFFFLNLFHQKNIIQVYYYLNLNNSKNIIITMNCCCVPE